MFDEKIPEMPDEGLLKDVDSDGVVVTELDDGTIEVDLDPSSPCSASFDIEQGHFKNMVDEIDKSELTIIAQGVCSDVEVDEGSREDWKSRISSGLSILGVKHKSGTDVTIEGMSTIDYPMISEAMVQFQARTLAEIFPSSGPVKTAVVGASNEDKREQAQRIQDHMNYQLMYQDKAYFWNVDKMLFLLPFFGSSFKKSYYDAVKKMVVSRYVSPLDLVVPYLADSIDTADRYTHKFTLSNVELDQQIRAGVYADLDLAQQDDVNEGRQEFEDVGDQRQITLGDDDSAYTLYEQARYIKLKDDEHQKPYLVTVNRETQQVLSIRKNWLEDDDDNVRIEWVTHYKFLPGLGFYGFGLPHLIGSLAEATTGTLRSMLDSAAFDNFQGGFCSSDLKMKEKGDMKLSMGEWKQVNMDSEDLQKAFYTPPFHPPSPAMAQVFGSLIDAGRRFSSTTENMVGDASNTGPVGTTMALIEQGSKVFSGIHRRVHVAAGQEFQIIAQLNHIYLDDSVEFSSCGKDQTISRKDYDGRIDVIPVSDPNIFSSTQRIAQSQALVRLDLENPGMFDKKIIMERFLASMNIPQYEELFADQGENRSDPVTENAGFITGQAAKAHKDQAHDAHIKIHEQLLGMVDQQTASQIQPIVMAHIQEHYALKYRLMMQLQLSQMAGIDIILPSDEDEDFELDTNQENEIAIMAAQMQPQSLMPQPPSPEEQQEQQEQAEVKSSFELDQAFKQQGFESEQQRKQVAFEAEQQRKDAELEMESSRKDFGHQSAEQLKSRSFEGDEARKDESFIENVQRKSVDHEFEKGLKNDKQ